MVQRYQNLSELLELIDEPNRSACQRLYADNRDLFHKASGSKTKHQAWEGGYVNHLEEIMNLASNLYDEFETVRVFPFRKSDALLTLYLHDLEKAWKYGSENPPDLSTDEKKREFIDAKIEEYGIVLTDDHRNALKYVHGEGDDYHPTERVQGPLAAFIHICDVWSARIWHDHPKQEDGWFDSSRGS